MKFLSKDKEIKRLEAPKNVYIPMSQHIGAPAKCVVKKGDMVKVGTKLGEMGGFVSANIFSSVSGTVKDIVMYPNVFGAKSQTVVIENDERQIKENFNPLKEEESKLIIEKIKEGGIVGMGGATFPTHVKLSPPPEKPIDTIIINGAECEPYLTSDYRLMLEMPEKVIGGLELLLKALNAKFGYIGVESNKIDIYQKIAKLLEGKSNMKAVLLKTKYPQGAEKQLIYAITKRKVPTGGLPMDVGVVVQNSGTAAAIYELIKEGKPLYERIVTVTGNGIKEPGNFLIPIGTPISYVIEKCGGLTDDAGKIILGGPMMGISVDNLDIPVTKGTSGILVMTENEIFKEDYDRCIRCGKCVTTCPMNLSPFKYIDLGEQKKYLEAAEWNVLDCIECGSCVYACPSKRPIIQFVKMEKAKIIEERKKGSKK
jgi:electron transport complex protein RnfC